jgi:hypothetical protein
MDRIYGTADPEELAAINAKMRERNKQKRPAYLSLLTALGFVIFGGIPWIIGWWAIVMLILGNL